MQQAIIDNQHFIYYLFNLTAGGLYGLSLLTHLSYQCWNIVIWFGVLPATWIYIIGLKTTAWLNLLSLPIFIYIFAIHTWNTWFDKAVALLYKIGYFIHYDYKVTSVLVCVLVPLFVYLLLFSLCTSRKTFKRFSIVIIVLTGLILLLFPLSNMYIRYYLGYAV